MCIMLPCLKRALSLALEHVGNFGMTAAWLQPWRQCVLYVCSNFKPLCHKVIGASKMHASWLADM